MHLFGSGSSCHAVKAWHSCRLAPNCCTCTLSRRPNSCRTSHVKAAAVPAQEPVHCLQEDVAELKRSYRAAVDALGTSLTEHDIQKLLEEHVRVFAMNNTLLRSFPVSARHHARALAKMLPTQLTVGVVGAAIALLVLWLAPRLLAWRALGDPGPPPSAFDAASGVYSAAPGKDKL